MIYRLATLWLLLLSTTTLALPPQAPNPPQAPPLPPQVQVVEPKPKEVIQPKVVAPPKSGWQNGGYHSTHNCPVCGRSQYIQSGQNRDGSHNHTCRYDGTMWRH